MPDTPPIIVLKFGGSVLLDEQRLRIAVHEIYRWRREGWSVIAVVSALAGRTEELIKRCDALCDSASDEARAGILSLGESESASLLGIHLDRAGIPARVISPETAGFIAEGAPLNALPVSLNIDRLKTLLTESGVIVFPGFIANDTTGSRVTLGRGGSDLTAVYLAQALSAERCRLIKDVDGLYESDPATSSTTPRYSYASYEDALATDGSIIQHKAVEFAQAHGVEFELGRFNGSNPTRVGAGDTQLSRHADSPIPLTLAICGAGVVGGGVLDLVGQLPELFQVTGVARNNPGRSTRDAAYPITSDAIKLAETGADVVVELIGGTSTALQVAQAALRNGSSLVTANKALIAEDGATLRALRHHSDQHILYSASVGGAMPLLEAIASREIHSVTGILNGTTNYVLGQLELGSSLNTAVQDAQSLGYAEADASRDLDGRDALDKLLVIASEQHWIIPESHIALTSIQSWLDSVPEAYPAKHVAHVDHQSASVTVQPLQSHPALANTQDEWNYADIQLADGQRMTVRGKGAGRWPTSESVLADLLELSRTHSHQTSKEALCHA